MSADNGYILRRNQDDKYVLQMYFASADEYPKIVTGPANGSYIFDSLQGALLCYEMNCESEYGLTVHIKEVTYDHQHRMESWGNFGQRMCSNKLHIHEGRPDQCGMKEFRCVRSRGQSPR